MTHPSDDPRRSHRSKVFLAGTIECADGEFPVTLRDLSEHGALIETATSLREESEVWFRRNELRVHGFIAWVNDNFAGIAFSRKLKSDVVLRHVGRPHARPVEEVVHRRPAVARPGMTPEEQRWAAEILGQPVRRSQPR